MKKTLFFDIGGVIIFFSHQKMCQQMADLLEMPFHQVYDFLLHPDICYNYELGHISSEELHQRVNQLGGKPCHYLDFLQALSHIFEPNQLIFPLIEELKQQKIQLALLSNTCEPHYNYLVSHYPIFQLFDFRILSHEVHLRKPDPKIYQRALWQAKTTEENSFYIDDVEANVLAAQKLKIPCQVYHSVDKLKTTLKDYGFLL